MKLAITLLLTCFSYVSFSQTGAIKFDITITDSAKPYFLEIFSYKEKSFVPKTTIITNGSYVIKDLKEGSYSFEFYSFESKARHLHMDSVNVIKDSTTNLQIVYPGPCKFVYGKDYKPVCPYYHSDKIVKIIYGYPSSNAITEAKKGLIHLGGCIISDCDPKYYCTIHKKEL